MFAAIEGIRKKLFYGYLALVIPLIIVIAFTHYNHYIDKRNEVIKNRVVFARDVAYNFEHFIHELSTLERAVGTAIFKNDYTRRNASDYLAENAIKYPLKSLDFVRVTGEVYASSNPSLIGKHLKLGTYDIKNNISKLSKENNVILSSLHEHEDGGLSFDVITGIWSKKGLAGAMVASVDVTRINEALTFFVPGGGYNITDSSGTLIYQNQRPNTPLSKRNWSQYEFIKEASKGKEFISYGLIFPIDNSYRMGVQVPINNIGWSAGSFVPVDEVMAPIRLDILQSSLIAIMFIFVASLLGLWIGHGIVKPITSLAEKAKTIAQGNFDEDISEIKADSELKELVESFNTMRLSIKDYIQELHGLVESGQKMNTAPSVMGVETALAESLINHFDADTIWIALYDDTEKLLKVNYSKSARDVDLYGLAVAPGQGVAGKVLMTGKPALIEDIKASEFVYKEALLKAGIKSLITMPLVAGSGPLGVVGLYTPRLDEGRITDKEMNLLMALANEAAVAIDNVRLYEETATSEQKLRAYNEDLRILNKVALDLASGLDLDELLEKIERNAMQLVGADFVSIGLYDEKTGKIDYHHYVSSTKDKAGIQMLPDDLGFSDIVLKVKRTVYTNDYKNDPRAKIEAITAGITATVVAPMVSGEALVGFIQVALTENKEFTDNDINLLEAVASQSAIAVENARLYERERYVADTLQNMLLAAPENLPGIKVGLTYRSAGEQTKVGGDFYDFIELKDGRIGVVIGDVSGKGLEAATATALAKMTIRAYAYEYDLPSEVLSHANKAIASQLGSGQFITMIYLILDPRDGKFSYANAGHPAPLIVDYADGITRQLMVGMAPLGVIDDDNYETYDDKLDIAEVLIMYTDGLLEARKDSEIFGEERIAEAALSVGDPNIEVIPGRLVEIAEEYSGGKLRDDVAVLVLIRDTANNKKNAKQAAKSKQARKSNKQKDNTTTAQSELASIAADKTIDLEELVYQSEHASQLEYRQSEFNEADYKSTTSNFEDYYDNSDDDKLPENYYFEAVPTDVQSLDSLTLEAIEEIENNSKSSTKNKKSKKKRPKAG